MKRPFRNITRNRAGPEPPSDRQGRKPFSAKHLAIVALAVIPALALLATPLFRLAHTPQPSRANLFLFALAWLAGLALTIAAATLITSRRHRRQITRLAAEIARRCGNPQGLTVPRVGKPCYDKLIDVCNSLLESHAETLQQLEKVHARVEGKVNDRTRALSLALRRLEKTARIDPLSGLANRGHFDVRLAILHEECLTGPGDLACMMIDMDNFKAVNDTFGHSVGDAIISFLGELLGASIREEDVAARLGGDEFVIVLPDTDVRSARWIAERIRRMFAREVASLLPELYEDAQPGDDSRITVCQRDQGEKRPKRQPRLSIGIATVKRNKARTPRELLDMADRALYQAKKSGRDLVATLQPAPETEDAQVGAASN